MKMTLEEAKTLYPEFNILDIIEDDKQILVKAMSDFDSAVCPLCGTTSNKINQRTTKYIKDIPFNNKEVTLEFHSRVFNCLNKNCSKIYFTESSRLFELSKKMTSRLIDIILQLSSNTSCRKVNKLLKESNTHICKATINNLNRKHN